MTLLNRLRQALLHRPIAETAAAPHKPRSPIADQIPPFHLQTAELMRFDPQIRIGLGARNGLLMAAQIEIHATQPAVSRWVQQQWDRLWCGCANQMLRAKLYGFLPFEVSLRAIDEGEFRGFIEVARLRDRRPSGARLLVRDDEPVGFVWNQSATKDRTVLAPHALVCTYGAEFDNPYGCSLLERAYPAWYEKWMEGGVKQTLRLRMLKDAYVGDILWYPPDRKIQLPDGRAVSWRDIARDLVENRTSGGALTLPLVYDHDGRKLVDYTPPQDTGRATSIFDWKQDVDKEIWKALEVPPEIIEASVSGSGYSGRWIPFAVALSAVQSELAELVHCIDRDLLQPLVRLNFGRDARYEIRPRPLTEIFAEQFQRPS